MMTQTCGHCAAEFASAFVRRTPTGQVICGACRKALLQNTEAEQRRAEALRAESPEEWAKLAARPRDYPLP